MLLRDETSAAITDIKAMSDDASQVDQGTSMMTTQESSILLITGSSTSEAGASGINIETKEDDPGTQTTSKDSDCSVCRICQLGSDESGEILRDTACSCKGSVKRVHATCLVMWVRQKGSNICEICGETFFVSPPPSQPDLVPIVSIQNWPNNASQGSVSARLETCLENRCVFAALVILLILITGSAGAFTVKAFKVLQTDHSNASGDPHVQFLLCLCFLLLSGTATLIFTGSWIYFETAAHCRMIRRRRILQQLGLLI